MSQNDEAARQGRPDTNMIPAEHLSKRDGLQDAGLIDYRERLVAVLDHLEEGAFGVGAARIVLLGLLEDLDLLGREGSCERLRHHRAQPQANA
ncbi:MAG: hypothetical protein ABIR67_10645 [Gaiellaceae bacterium]